MTLQQLFQQVKDAKNAATAIYDETPYNERMSDEQVARYNAASQAAAKAYESYCAAAKAAGATPEEAWWM